jgi:hypothetical protein
VGWAKMESDKSWAGTHKDLRRLVQWKMRKDNEDGEDFNGGKPSRATKTSTASNAGPSTSRSVTANRGMPPAWPLPGPSSRRKAGPMEATPATPAPMESSIPPEESARIQELEAQLAVLRDKHKLPPSSAASSATGWSKIDLPEHIRIASDSETEELSMKKKP